MWLQDFFSAKILICFSSEHDCGWNDKCRAALCFWLETHRHAGGEEKIHQEYTSDSVWGEILISRSCQKWCVSLLKQELKTMSLGNLDDFFFSVLGKAAGCPKMRNLGSESIKEDIKGPELVELLPVQPCGHICLPQVHEAGYTVIFWKFPTQNVLWFHRNYFPHVSGQTLISYSPAAFHIQG